MSASERAYFFPKPIPPHCFGTRQGRPMSFGGECFSARVKFLPRRETAGLFFKTGLFVTDCPRVSAWKEPRPPGMQPGRVVGSWDAGAFGVGSVFYKSMSDKDL